MKKNSTLLLFAISTTIFAQSCDALKLENKQLKDKLQQYGITFNTGTSINSFSDDIKFNFIKCIGDKKQQTVTVYFNLTNPSLPNQSVTLMNNYFDGKNLLYANALDEIGNGYKPLGAKFGASNGFFSSNVLSTGGNPLMASITFANVLPNVKKLNIVSFFVRTRNLIGGGNKIEGLTEIKNININWK